MDIKLTQKNSILKTAGKFVSEDINLSIDESMLGGGEGGGSLKAFFDVKKSCYYEFYNQSNITSNQLDSLLSYSDTENVTNMGSMFSQCSGLTTIPLLNTSKVTDMSYMFQNCTNLTTIPLLNTSNVTNMSGMFQNCTNLTTIPALDASKVTNTYRTFYKCTSLKSILMTGMKTSFTIEYSTQFERNDLVTILNNLATVSSATLTMGATNLAKLTDTDKAIATNKGWTLA